VSEQGPTPPPEEPAAESPRHRLDPDLAAATARGATDARGDTPDAPQLPPAVIDTRKYRWTIGIFGLILVIAFSVYEWGKHGVVSPGVPAGERLHNFVAPLATIGPDKPANPRPKCDPAHPNPLALNVCGRTPLVLAFFATGSGPCKRQVDTLQAVSHEFAPRGIQFAAVAINASKQQTAKLVREHHWTIPVAFDSEGAVGALYGVEICPIVELARPGGVVAQRLIGEHWIDRTALAERVRALLTR
jgi:thiol-disulfide isomerase/thioredoxin